MSKQDQLMRVAADYAMECVAAGRNNKHLCAIERIFARYPKYNPVRSQFKFQWGELRGVINGTHRNLPMAQFIYADLLAKAGWI